MKKRGLKGLVAAIIILITSGVIGAVVNINLNEEGFTAEIQYSNQQIPALIEDDLGEAVETTEFEGEEIPTVEEVDGGKFEDATTGVSLTDGEYEDLGWSEIYNVSSPETFRDDTIGKCIYANNRYGAQCVSLARVFWWSYANRDVSTCGTGMAKGMMNCAEQNASDDFEIFWNSNNIQAGDWLVFNGGQYGHVGMALGPVKNGYVALLGENQGGAACRGGGSATNIINISIKNLIGGYRPKAYIKPAPEPGPAPIPISGCVEWHVVRGDTMSKIMLVCEGTVVYGEPMNDYAKTWYSLVYKPGQSVYDGWNSETGVGLYAGDDIEHRLGDTK